MAVLMAENDRLARKNAHLSEQSNRLAVEVARLNARNERLAADLAWLRAQLPPAPAQAESRKDMQAIRAELLSLLDQANGSSFH